MNKNVSVLVAINALAVACGASPGTQPHDMSQAGHEQAAASEDQQAEQHAAQYDAGAEEPKKGCLAKGPCWTSLENPTEKHLEMAEAHRKTAAEHRAAAAALAEAEAKACADLSEADRDISPFAHREDVVSVAPQSRRSRIG